MVIRNRRFSNRKNQESYDNLRHSPITDKEELERIKIMNASMNAYVIGFTLPHIPPLRFSRGSQAYAAWAAGVDNALEIKVKNR